MMNEVRSSFPMVTRNGETFMSEAQVARHIREMCGDEIGEYVEKRMMMAQDIEPIAHKVRLALDRLCDISFSDLEYNLNGAVTILEQIREGK